MVLRVCYMDTQWRIKGTETEAGKGAEAETGDPTLLLSQTEAKINLQEGPSLILESG